MPFTPVRANVSPSTCAEAGAAGGLLDGVVTTVPATTAGTAVTSVTAVAFTAGWLAARAVAVLVKVPDVAVDVALVTCTWADAPGAIAPKEQIRA